MTFHEIVDKVREKFSTADVTGIPGKMAAQFNLTGEGEGSFYAEVKDGKLSIEPYEYYDRDVLITISGDNLLKMLDGKLNPITAYTMGKLRVQGNLDAALEIVKFM